MKLSTRTRYGVRLMLELAFDNKKGAVQLNEIAKNQNISEKYLGQIVIQLKQTGLIGAIRGAQGGYYLTKKPEDITILEIVEGIDGKLNLVDCVSDNTACDRCSDCVTSKLWTLLTKNIKDTLEKVTLADLVSWSQNKTNELSFII